MIESHELSIVCRNFIDITLTVVDISQLQLMQAVTVTEHEKAPVHDTVSGGHTNISVDTVYSHIMRKL